MEFEEIFSSTRFWLLTAVGEVAFVIMLIVLKSMGQQAVMPTWVKLVTFIVVPIIAFGWSAAMGED